MRSRVKITSQTKSNKTDKRNLLLGIVFIALLTLLVYVPAMRAQFIWDDNDYVQTNMTLRTIHGLCQIWTNPHSNTQYYPLTYTSFWIDYHLFGLNPAGFHIVNILLHALSAILLWIVLRRLRVPGAWLAAAIFAIHPANAESVAWITERKNTLSGVFYFCSILAYLRYAGISREDDSKSGSTLSPPKGASTSRWYYALSLLLFVFALFSKTVTCTLPAVLLLILWWKRGINWRSWVSVAPFFALGLAAARLTSTIENTNVGATGEEWSLTLPGKLILAGKAFWFYIAKDLWPSKLIFIYPRWEINPSSLVQFAYPICALGVVAALWLLRERIGKGPLVAVLFYSITIAPALGFFNVFFMIYSFVQDHFQYLASIGIFTLAAGALTVGFEWLTCGLREPAVKPLRICLPIALLAVLGTLTWCHTHIYNDLETLWRDTIARNPSAWIAHDNLSALLSRRQDYAEALVEAREAVRLNPKHAEAHDNLGVALSGLNYADDAAKEFRLAIQLDPNFKPAYINLAALLARSGQLAEALDLSKKAVEIDPKDFAAHNTLGTVLMGLGKPADAAAEFRTALDLQPDSTDALYNRAVALIDTNQFDEAITDLRQVLESQPQAADAHGNLAKALYLNGDYAGAWDELHMAVKCGGPVPKWAADLSRKMLEPKTAP